VSTGDDLTDDLIPLATQLIWAVRQDDAERVAELIRQADTVAGDPLTAAHGLVIVLAALCPDDLQVSTALAWRTNPAEYHRLRAAGVGSTTAGVLASQRAREVA